MSLTSEELQLFINQELPKARKRETTIFDIARFPHYENVMSSCYGYFLNQEAGHELAGVFLDTLLRLVDQKSGKQLNLDTWKVETEVTTKSQRRIDLLISGTGDDKGKFIIVENKIYHWLHNDLLDYWNHCDGKEINKAGIILSLTKVRVPEGIDKSFANILHSEWIEAIRNSPGLGKLPVKLQVYLDDFCTALGNLKNDSIMDNQARFFFNNIEKVNEVVETQTAAWRFVIQQLRVVAEDLELNFTGSSDNYRYLELPGFIGSGVYYTVMFDELLKKERTLRVAIEVQNKQLGRLNEFDSAVADQVKQLGLLYKCGQHGDAWLHYVGQDYTFAGDELETLGRTLAGFIRKDLEPIMKTITTILKQHE